LLHGLADADDYEDDTGSARDEPLTVHLFHVLDVDLIGRTAFEDDSVVFGERFERGFVVERKWRNDDANADLKTAAGAPFRFGSGCQFPENSLMGVSMPSC